MNNYILELDESGSPYLVHYGVLGMKWGVRHNPKGAYSKATKKFNKLASKSDKAMDKAGKHRQLGERKRAIGMGKKSRARHTRLAGKYKRSAMKNAKRASKWLKQMEREFSKQSVVGIDSSYISKGAAMAERYRTLRIM